MSIKQKACDVSRFPYLNAIACNNVQCIVTHMKTLWRMLRRNLIKIQNESMDMNHINTLLNAIFSSEFTICKDENWRVQCLCSIGFEVLKLNMMNNESDLPMDRTILEN